MTEGERTGVGILPSLRRLGSSVIGLLGTRVELFVVELQEEKLRAVNLLVWLGVALALALAAILVAVAGLALFFWELAGYAGLFGVALAVFAMAAAVFVLVRRRVQRGEPFAATVGEFRKDVEWLRRNN